MNEFTAAFAFSVWREDSYPLTAVTAGNIEFAVAATLQPAVLFKFCSSHYFLLSGDAIKNRPCLTHGRYSYQNAFCPSTTEILLYSSITNFCATLSTNKYCP